MDNHEPFAVFDIDGTLIRWQLYHAIVDVLVTTNPEARAVITAARRRWKHRVHEESFKAYEADMVVVYEKIMRGLEVGVFEKAVETVFDEYKDQAYKYTRQLVRTLKDRGYMLFAISGSHDEIVKKVAAHYGFDDAVGVKYLHKNGRFTGETIHTWNSKPQLLKQLVTKHGAAFAASVGIGDSEGDIAMLELVEKPIAFNPSKKLFQHAEQRGWRIIIERKNMIYELERHDGTYVLAQTNC